MSNAVEERAPLLPSDATKTGAISKDSWWNVAIPPDELVVPFMIITFATARVIPHTHKALDVATYRDFHTFTTNQTGNTVLLALSALSLGRQLLLPAGVSLCGFLIAGVILGQLGVKIGPHKRIFILSSLLFQIITLVVPAILISKIGPKSCSVGGRLQWVVILLTAVSGGAQVALAASSGPPEIPTGMMTTPYARFISDPHLFDFRTRDTPRDRRAVYVVVFWVGAFAGAVAMLYTDSWVVFLGGVLCKLVAGWWVWGYREGENAGDESS